MRKALSRRTLLLAAGTGAAGAVAGASLAGPRAASDDLEPTVADIGFCTDMTAHHIQALAMCHRVLGRDTGDPVQAAATEVLQTQAIEIGTMRAWLTDWGATTASPETTMAWMGMSDGAGVPFSMMPGLASDEEMRALSLAEGLDRGRLWIELMRTHHVGGVDMAKAAIELVGAEKVRRLARIQVDVQTYEIEQYDQLLTTAYA
ncbi:MAG: DUF305 domain-containing protein [Acidimicrobiia bacterium]|nr:DUF305 domain-containing protein [Acidimicrobiia bacterium]